MSDNKVKLPHPSVVSSSTSDNSSFCPFSLVGTFKVSDHATSLQCLLLAFFLLSHLLSTSDLASHKCNKVGELLNPR